MYASTMASRAPKFIIEKKRNAKDAAVAAAAPKTKLVEHHAISTPDVDRGDAAGSSGDSAAAGVPPLPFGADQSGFVPRAELLGQDRVLHI